MAVIGKSIREFRESLNISQQSLASSLGVSQALVSLMERGKIQNESLSESALTYLKRITGETPSRTKQLNKITPRAIVRHDSAGKLNWAWTSFSKTRNTSDIFEYVKLGQDKFGFLIADITGAGPTGTLQAAQLRFGFAVLSSTLSPAASGTLSYLGPISSAFRHIISKKQSPPSLGLIIVDAGESMSQMVFLGLPQPIKYTSDEKRFDKLLVNSSDFILKDPILAIDEKMVFKKNDAVLVFTDGFIQWLRESKNLSANQLNELIQEAVQSFRGNASGIINAMISAGSTDVTPELIDDATVFVITSSGRSGR